MFFESQTDVEKAHIVGAFRFKFSKVTVPAIRERMLASLVNVSAEPLPAVTGKCRSSGHGARGSAIAGNQLRTLYATPTGAAIIAAMVGAFLLLLLGVVHAWSMPTTLRTSAERVRFRMLERKAMYERSDANGPKPKATEIHMCR